jgi:hypothetical protein
LADTTKTCPSCKSKVKHDVERGRFLRGMREAFCANWLRFATKIPSKSLIS